MLRPPLSPLEIPIKLRTFLSIFWPYRTPHPPGNSNPFCGGCMDIFWNCTFVHLPLSVRSVNRFVSSLVFMKSTLTSCCLRRRNFKRSRAVRPFYGKSVEVIGLHDFHTGHGLIRTVCKCIMYFPLVRS